METETVVFITTETGTDLILAFAVAGQDDPSTIESLILVRTPKYEFIVEEHERGVRVSFERYEDEEDEFLQKVEYASGEAIVRLQTTARKFELDVRKVDPGELNNMRKLLKLMNYDHKLQLSGV